MKLFACPACGATVHFSNSLCTACGAEIGYAPEAGTMVAPGPDGSIAAHGRTWRKCTHYARLMGCTWMVGDDQPFCLSCRLNRTIPDLSNPRNLTLWKRLEEDKRRVVYAALRLGLPVTPRAEAPGGLAFDFLADSPAYFTEAGRVLTGHAAGLITINIAEADPVAREEMRAQMAEPYRTILGHLRHETGHYYWDRLVRDTGWLGPFRDLFGDERADYAAALQTHYANGAPPDWPQRHVSAYAASHPWEDWAESWSHYLHMIDTLETAWAFGLRLDPQPPEGAPHPAAGSGHPPPGGQPPTTPPLPAPRDALAAEPARDPCAPGDFDALMAQWLPLTVALNALNASMGHEPAYPFTIGPAVRDKLRFVHAVIHGARTD
ncbi:MAG: zinc-binding metallopeptidase family protein [Alkalilacustris sp.]